MLSAGQWWLSCFGTGWGMKCRPGTGGDGGLFAITGQPT